MIHPGVWSANLGIDLFVLAVIGQAPRTVDHLLCDIFYDVQFVVSGVESSM